MEEKTRKEQVAEVIGRTISLQIKQVQLAEEIEENKDELRELYSSLRKFISPIGNAAVNDICFVVKGTKLYFLNYNGELVCREDTLFI